MTFPVYAILIRPKCDNEGISHLGVRVTLSCPEIKAGQALCHFDTGARVPVHEYTTDNSYATDAAGRLAITISKNAKASSYKWLVERDTDGDVSVYLDVVPRFVDGTTPMGDRLDLRRDQGGLIGSGRWFLPEVTYADRFLFSVEWDASLVPETTRAIWSYGQGLNKTAQDGPVPLLLNSIFMVGRINSFEEQHGMSSVSTVNWFGELPGYLEPVRQFNKCMIPYAYSTFDDELSLYSIFIRKAPRAHGGNNFASALLLEYSDERGPVSDSELVSLLTHELIHNWLFLGHQPTEPQNLWYIEGMIFSIFPRLFQIQENF